ncbi:ammonium transporter Rh type B-B [Formica exsecta]|uniref:ammonium transporter Rh type B-B n=1 Tax=Formica exsecta TaxID=72781 RepID=UPI001141A4C2|nr:ammonium transporter Rh type B-B [Formica exsecta]
MYSSVTEKQQVLMLLLIEIILIVLIGSMMTYGPEANYNLLKNHTGTIDKNKQTKKPDEDSLRIYPMYQDVHVMIWIGFGFLMTFLKRYSQSAVGLTFLVGAILVQVALICNGVTQVKLGNKAHLSLESLLNADVAVAAPLISMGAILGKVTYMQLIFMGIVELIMFTINMYIGEHLFMVVDAGGSMFVHVFGAYFGLAISFVFGLKERPKEHELEGSSYQSDIFAMIGTMFLWLFWPSFNSAALKGDDQQRAIINTLLSISASCVITFGVSALVSKEKFNMVHVQNSTLAGGVAIGTAAGMMCEPVGALVIGALSGAISVLGYKYLTPIIQRRLHIHDTCGVHNLHGMPGVLAAIFGALMAGLASETSYGYALYEIFPARAPSSEKKISEMRDNYGISPGFNRTAYQQAIYQLLSLAVTLGISIISGLITGLLLRTTICGWITDEQKFNDQFVWELEENSQDESSEKNREDSTHASNQIAIGHF